MTVTSFKANDGQAGCAMGIAMTLVLLFGLLILFEFGGAAAGEYMGGYLIEKSLSVDNVVTAVAMSPDIRVVVVRGAGDKAFVSGADISQFKDRREGDGRDEGDENVATESLSQQRGGVGF